MAGRFKANGRTYPDTPLGKARAHKDKQNARLADHGHRMTWRRLPADPVWRAAFRGTCRRCRGELDCSEYGPQWRSASSPTLLKFMGVNIVKRCGS
jgi:hypothetical protein